MEICLYFYFNRDEYYFSFNKFEKLNKNVFIYT